MKFLQVFNEVKKGNYALTEESIYASLQSGNELVPLYGGNKEHISREKMISVNTKNKKGNPVKIFSGEGIILSLDGSAGSMTYKNNEKFVLNHHAGFITLRDDAEKEVCLEFFAIYMQNYYRNLCVSDGSKTLSLEQLYSENFELPSFETQKQILKILKPVKNSIEILVNLKERLQKILEKEVVFKYTDYQAKNVPIKTCIDYLSGNQGLTEEYIYKMLQNNNPRYEVLSSSTEVRTMMGSIPYCNVNDKPIKVFENKEGLLVTRNGKAGQTKYLSPGKYTVNDHAYILFVSDDSEYDIDLEWLSIQYKAQFLQYASSSDNGTWNMSGFFKYTCIDIPLKSEQELIKNRYNKIKKYIEKIENIEQLYNSLISKEVIMKG